MVAPSRYAGTSQQQLTTYFEDGMHRLNGSSLKVAVFLFALWNAFYAESYAQKTIHVPLDVNSIQAAIDASSSGDTVLVAPGTYKETIDFKGKNITVTSSGGAAGTIIDASQNGVAVTFQSGETRAAVLNGFTVQNSAIGTTNYSDGIFISASSPSITNNIITNNRGYGIEVYFGGADIVGNTISNTTTANDPNYDFGCDYDDGAGIAIQGYTAGYEVLISGNKITNNVGRCEGGGIKLYAAGPSVTITNNLILANQSLGEGGGIYLANGNQVTIVQNVIANNIAGAAGGGVYIGAGSEANQNSGPVELFLTNNTITNNRISPNPDIFDFYTDGSQIAFGGYFSQSGIFNDIVTASDSFAAIGCNPTYSYLNGAPLIVVASNVLNTGTGGSYGGACTAQNGFGNISADPKFKGASSNDYHLLSGSPAIDSGYNAALEIPSSDIEGNARIQNATGLSSARVDMGAYEVSGAAERRVASQISLAGPATVTYGQAVQLKATVSSQSAVTPGSVTFLENWNAVSKSPLASDGTTTLTNSNLVVGQHWFLASFDGNSGVQQSVSPAIGVFVQGFSTSTSLAFSANPVNYGEPVTFTADVTSPAGTPTGQLLFKDSSASQTPYSAKLDASGIAIASVPLPNAGIHFVQAMYQGQGGFLPSNSSNIQLLVNKAATTSSVSSSFTTATAGQAVTLSAVATASTTPTGSFYFSDGNNVMNGVPLDGSGKSSLTTSSLTAGKHSITARYGGDGNHDASTSPAISLTVQDFSVTQDATTPITVIAGNTATIPLTLSPIEGFSGTVTITCSAPAIMKESTCSAPSAAISNNSPATTTVTITTSASHQIAFRGTATAGATALCALLLVTPWVGRRSRSTVLLVILSTALAGTTACGGGGNKVTAPIVDAGTPPGTYQISLQLTSGTASHTLVRTIIVQ